VRLVDIENDGALEIITKTRFLTPAEDRIRCYSNSGALLWEVVAGSELVSTFHIPADLAHDGVKEIVFSHGSRLGIISASGSSAVVSSEIDLDGDSLYVSPPLAVDVNGDDQLEIVTLRRENVPFIVESPDGGSLL
jgi:hypothetical protein